MSIYTDFERRRNKQILRGLNKAPLTGKGLLWFGVKVLLGAIVVGLFVIGWLAL